MADEAVSRHDLPMAMRLLILLLVLAGTLPVQAAAARADGAAERADTFVRQLTDLINAYRLEQGLQPLLPVAELATLADEHSEAMAAQRVLTHEGFRTRYARAGSKVCVENLGWNHRTPQALLEGWRQSPGHHRNLLNPKVERVGIAARQRYVTFFACR